jgi:ElaB/YqjD/DUF883 family membrane-anchored ribosome-binding protein
MEERLTDDTLTREQAMDVARHIGKTALDEGRQQAQKAGAMASDTLEQAKAMARDVGEQARAAAVDAGATAQDLARRAREQATAASDALYQQGMRAGEYLTENVNEYPLTALLIAGAIGYGIAFLFHARWQTTG